MNIQHHKLADYKPKFQRFVENKIKVLGYTQQQMFELKDNSLDGAITFEEFDRYFEKYQELSRKYAVFNKFTKESIYFDIDNDFSFMWSILNELEVTLLKYNGNEYKTYRFELTSGIKQLLESSKCLFSDNHLFHEEGQFGYLIAKIESICNLV